MSDPVAALVEQGLALSPADRERLVDLLVASLDADMPATLHPSWQAEIERRLEAYDRGEVEAIDADEVLAKARRLAR